MRGGWQGSGTWWTTGPDPAVVAGLLVVLAVIGVVEWIASHFWELVAGTAVVVVLTAAAVRWLIRWTNRREAAWSAQRAALRADAEAREIGNPVTGIGTRVPDSRAIEGGLHIHFHGLDDGERAEVIRQARSIGGDAGP